MRANSGVADVRLYVGLETLNDSGAASLFERTLAYTRAVAVLYGVPEGVARVSE